jgi:hypothetical protein
VEAGLKDRNHTALLDRGWMMLKVRAVIEECAEMRTPAAGKTLIAAVRLMAQLQGELPFGRRGCQRPVEALPQPAGPSAAMERIKAILAEADQRAAAARAADRLSATPVNETTSKPIERADLTEAGDQFASPPNRLDQLVAEAEAMAARSRPRPAVVDPRVVAPPAAPSSEHPPTVPAEPVVTRPDLADDGLPIGEVRPFRGVGRITRPPVVEPRPAEPVRDGPVLPRVSDGPIKYRGASPYFMGAWA